MQPITIIHDPTHSAQSTHAKINKTSHVNQSMGAICTAACLAERKRLASAALHKVIPQVPLQWLSSCQRTFCDDELK
jgi:hypothetical protein